MTTTVKFVEPNGQLRGYSIIRHDDKPRDMRFEVIYQIGGLRRDVSWRFFASRKAADAFASEVR